MMVVMTVAIPIMRYMMPVVGYMYTFLKIWIIASVIHDKFVLRLVFSIIDLMLQSFYWLCPQVPPGWCCS